MIILSFQRLRGVKERAQLLTGRGDAQTALFPSKARASSRSAGPSRSYLGESASCWRRGGLALFPRFPRGTWNVLLLRNNMIKGHLAPVVTYWLSRPW